MYVRELVCFGVLGVGWRMKRLCENALFGVGKVKEHKFING